MAVLPPRALGSVNLLQNGIGAERAQHLATIVTGHAPFTSLCGNKGNETALDMSGENLGADGAIMLAPEIVANEALTSLRMSECAIATREAGEALGRALAKHSALKELDLSGDGYWSVGVEAVGFAKGLADGVTINGALTSLNLANNEIGAKGAKYVAEAVKHHVSARFGRDHTETLTPGSLHLLLGGSR